MNYTSTPLKRIGVSRQSSALNFESEESADGVTAGARPVKRRKSARSLRKERISGARIIESADRGERKRRRSKRRRSEGGKNNNAEDEGNENSERRRKERNVNRRENETTELPIAELLRKAQENQKSQLTRYEEPIPLSELTTDTLYVQGRNGFSAVKISNCRNVKSCGEKLLKPIHVAIKIHNLSTTVMFFCQGLLGGIALSQVILITKIYPDSNILEQIDKTNYPHLMSGIFLFLVSVCLLAAMDKIDLAHLDLEHLREMFCQRRMMIVTFPLYLVAICIHLNGINDDGNTTDGDHRLQGSDVVGDEKFAAHRQIQIWKFVLCIVAWLFIAIGPNDDMTAMNLEAMQKYVT